MSQQPSRTVSSPPTFRDGEGRTWQIKLTYALADRILAATQVDLIPDDNDVDALTGLLFKTRKLGSVLWECASDQAARLDPPVDQAKFKEALDGDAFSDGWRAVVDAIIFFIQKRSPETARAVEELIEKQLAMVEKGATLMVKMINSEETTRDLDEAADQMAGALQTSLKRELAESATKSRR